MNTVNTVDGIKALVQHYLEEVYRGNLAILDEVISPEYTTRGYQRPPGLTAAASYKASFSAFRAAFPDSTIRLDALIAQDDLVALHATITATHLGEWRGIPPTGKQVTWTATAFRRVRDGKLVEGFATWDWLGLLEQLGATITPPAATTPA
jgi:steroid delta-isomerase-like uncharacterized protein